MIDFDCETTGFQPYSGTQHPFLFQFGDDEGNTAYYHFSPDDQSNREAIQEWFDRAAADPEGIEAWNSKFDLHFAHAAGFTLPPEEKWNDGMVRAHIIDERRSIALQAVARDLFGEPPEDLSKPLKEFLTQERARRKKAAKEAGEELVEPNYSDVPDDIMIPYALGDIDDTRKVRHQYAPIIEAKKDLKGVYEFEQKDMAALFHAERRGIPADANGYRRLQQEVAKNLEGLAERCAELAAEVGIEDLNPKSSPQIHKALIARDADLSSMEEKEGKLPMDAENLRAVDDLLAEAILEFRSEYKVLSTYVKPMIHRSYVPSMRTYKEPFIAPDGRIHSTYRQVGARTGRMSNADPNMQNQPRDDLRLRYNIVADEGHKLVAVDLSNIEMRLFAAFAGRGPLLTAVRNREDIHVKTAEALGLRDRRRAGGSMETARSQGKVYNFSRIYGGGLKTIKKQFRCDTNQARIYKKRFDDAYPEIGRLQARINARIASQGYLQSPWGRRYRVSMDENYKAVNYLVQGTAADLLKQALIDLHELNVPVVALIHDEILVHCREEDAEDYQEMMIHAMTSQSRPGGRLWDDDEDGPVVPLDAEGDIVDRWSQAKDPEFVPLWAQAA